MRPRGKAHKTDERQIAWHSLRLPEKGIIISFKKTVTTFSYYAPVEEYLHHQQTALL